MECSLIRTSGQLYRSIMTNTEDAHQLLERVLGDKRIQQTLLDDAVRSLQVRRH